LTEIGPVLSVLSFILRSSATEIRRFHEREFSRVVFWSGYFNLAVFSSSSSEGSWQVQLLFYETIERISPLRLSFLKPTYRNSVAEAGRQLFTRVKECADSSIGCRGKELSVRFWK
jgi:hypothetical protein